MADALLGAWNYESADNLDAFMDAANLCDKMKEMARNGKPNVSIEKEGNTWSIKTEVGDKKMEQKYPLGEAVETMTFMGKMAKATLEEKDGGLLETQVMEGLTLTLFRAVVGGKYTVTMTANGVTATVSLARP